MRSHDVGDVHRLTSHQQFAPVELTRQKNLLRDLAEAGGLRGDHLEQLLPLVGIQLDVAAEERHGRAVDGGHRRAELMRDRRHEVVLLVFEPALARDVAERVDDAVGDLDGYERQPEVVPIELEG